MQSIFNKLFTGDSYQACQQIIEKYKKQGFCIINYLYFANIVGKQLFDLYKAKYSKSLFKTALLADYQKINYKQVLSAYKDALLHSDFLFPDGIALQLFYFFDRRYKLDNLNGTDFAPFLLEYLRHYFPQSQVNVMLYGTYTDLLRKTCKALQSKGHKVIYSQDGYSNLDWNRISNLLKKQKNSTTILLVGRTTPDFPIQEIRSQANLENIKKHKLIVMNQGGTFDFRAGKQKRAPQIIRKVKLERLWRVISDPGRNLKKVYQTLFIFKYIWYYLLLKKR